MALFFFACVAGCVPMTRPLKDLLAGIVADDLLGEVIGSYDIVGDIAIISVPPALVAAERHIAAAIIAGNRRLAVVARRDGSHHGEFRTMPLRVLAGEERTETEVRESGVRLRLDVEQVYYSGRSGQERLRIASLVQPGETVAVLFSGVAPYPLVLARHSAAAAIVGIEKNPLAHRYALENLRLNKRLGNITLHCGDVATVLPRLGRHFHRLIMPLPSMAEAYLPAALAALRPEGMLHFYLFARQGEFAAAPEVVEAACLAAGRRLAEHRVVPCGHCGPRTYRLCVDARIR